MNIVLRGCRIAAVTAALAVSLSGISGLVAGSHASASGIMTATTAVNVRSGPGTSRSILGVLYPGTRITATGPSVRGWTPVSYHGRAGYVSSQYLAGSDTAAAPRAENRSALTARALEDVNVRVGPGTRFPVSTVLPKGGTCWLNGATSNGYHQLIDGRWISAAWVQRNGTHEVTAPRLPAVRGQARATAALMIRTTSGSDFHNLGDVPSGTILNVTGVVENAMAQIVHQGAVRWVNARYLVAAGSAGPSAPSLPAPASIRYATVALDIRTTSDGSSETLTEVPKGTALPITGVVQHGRAQVIHRNALRWVTARYLSATAPTVDSGDSKGLEGLRPRTKAVVAESRARFPMITTYYGVRPDPLPDHPSGRAVDIMLPNYRSNQALGQEIADYFKANADRLGIEYIIFNQRIWSTARAHEGWRFMANRGGDTANHKDHVHITVK